MCYDGRANRFAGEYARASNRGLELAQAAQRDDIATIQKLVDKLSVTVAKTKFAKAAPVAVRRFVNFIDSRRIGAPVYGAAQERAYRAMRLLQTLGADLNARTTDGLGGVAAHIAAQEGDTAMVRLLHELGADVQCRRLDTGALPIHSSAREGHSDTTALLLELKSDPNVQDNEGRTPLWNASFEGHPGVIKTLVAAGAKVNLAESHGASPLYMASQEGHVRAIITLAELSASIDQESNNDTPPITIAAAAGQDEVVRLLAHLGARLVMSNGSEFWMHYQDDDKRQQAKEFWTGIVQAGGDEGTNESLRKRICMLEEAKMWDPRD